MTRRITIIVVLVLVLALILAVIRWHSEGRIERRWARVQVGMSADEVRNLLGSPDDVYLAAQGQSGSIVGDLLGMWLFDSYLEKWAYGRRTLADRAPILSEIDFFRSEVDTGSMLAPKDNDYVIYFSADGKVVRKVHPYKQRL
jgi:hypothetical protein